MAADTMKVKLSSTVTCFILVFLINTVYAGNIEDGKKVSKYTLIFYQRVLCFEIDNILNTSHSAVKYVSTQVKRTDNVNYRQMGIKYLLSHKNCFSLHSKKLFNQKLQHVFSFIDSSVC